MKTLRHVKSFFSGERAADYSPPLFLTFRSCTTLIVATVCIAIFNDILLYGIIVPVIPYSLAERVAIGQHEVQKWNTILGACFTASLCIGSLVLGSYADRGLSRRWTMLLGLFALLGSTLLLCLGRVISLLVLGRILQGLSAAVVWSAGLALMSDTMGDQIGVAMGYASMAMTIGSLISPTIGGAVYSRAGYYAVYYVGFGAILFDTVLRLVLIEKKVARQWVDGDHNNLELVATQRSSIVRDGPTGVAVSAQATACNEDTESTPVEALGGDTVKHPKLRILKSHRLLAANFGVLVQAGAV